MTERSKNTNMKVNGPNSEGEKKKKESYLEKKLTVAQAKTLQTDTKRNGRWKRRTLLSHPL